MVSPIRLARNVSTRRRRLSLGTAIQKRLTRYPRKVPTGTGGSTEMKDSKMGGWVIWGGGLILINVLSAVFDWGFWLY